MTSSSVALAAVAAAALATVAGATPPPSYPLHTNVTATVFWVGEPVGNGSTENNALSAWDDAWLRHYGGVDAPAPRRSAPWFPRFRPRENPFYLDLPYDDFTDAGNPRPDRTSVVPWAAAAAPALAAARRAGRPYSLMKNRWVELRHRAGGRTYRCYGQIEDSGPYVYDDARYVFGAGDLRPRSRRAHNAGLDVSPALRDCLHFAGVNNDENRVDWRFVDARSVPRGPWTLVVTTRQVYWP